MRLTFNLSLFVLALFAFWEKSLALNDYQIKNICKKEKKVSTCIRNLREKRTNLQKGNFIEIPVIPFKR